MTWKLYPLSPHSDTYLWTLGVLLAVMASFVSNLGLNLQKLLHLRNSKNGTSERDKKMYYTYPLWQLGLLLIICGSLADLAALVFAPQSLVAPLGSLVLVSNSILAPLLLHERTSASDAVSTLMILAGSALAVAFATHEDIVYSMPDLLGLYARLPFVIYATLVFTFLIALRIGITVCERREASRHTDPTSYLTIRPFHRFACAASAGTIGAQSVLFAKCTVELIVNSIREPDGLVFKSYQTYLIISCVFISILLQVGWLNEGLRRFDASYIVPVFTAFWILLSVTSGLVLFREWSGMTGLQIWLFALGVMITITGVVSISQREFEEGVEVGGGGKRRRSSEKRDVEKPSGPLHTDDHDHDDSDPLLTEHR